MDFTADVIINCIAISDIGQNEAEPQRAERINVPERWAALLAGRVPCLPQLPLLFVQLSTDQGKCAAPCACALRCAG